MKKKVVFASVLGLLFLASFSVVSAQSQTQTPLDSVQRLDEVIIRANTILGNKYVAQNRTGASYYV